MTEENNIKTFWEVIQENQIEIPVIQRDYAQGRQNDRVNQIREDFVEALTKVLQNENKEALHLDFVYGRIQGKDQELVLARNKEAVENVLKAVQGYASNLNMNIGVDISHKNEASTMLSYRKLIPLDGQQRLTTLFLLHWYLIQRINQTDVNQQLNHLEGFKYKTRKSTAEFCNYLTHLNNYDIKNLFVVDKKVSEQIEKSTSFFRVWKHDPSVKGMLVMLDAIHNRLKHVSEEQLQLMWNNLTTNRKITFDFLDLDELDQTDELYVKMNARGKQLSDFEHFKAWLQELINKDDSIVIKNINWEKDIDTTWLDLFWTHKAAKVFQVDDAIYNYIKSINLYKYIVNNKEEHINKSLIEKIRETNKEKNFITLNTFKKFDFFSSKSLDFLFNTLSKLSSDKLHKLNASLKTISCYPFIKGKNIDEFFFNESQNLSLWDRTYYYAYILFINDVDDFDENTIVAKFQSWMRICRNLIYNTYIQNPETFIKAIKSIYELSAFKFTIEEHLIKADFKVSFFESQAKEEVRKLKYFKLGDNWKEKILEYENHSYFYGQIDFLFDLLEEDQENFELFKHYGDTLCDLFKSDIEKENHLLQRSLLAQGNYTIGLSGQKRTFCKSDKGNLRALNDNWRKVFNDEGRLKILKSLLDDKRPFSDIVKSYSESNWRKYFIKYPSAIAYCKNRFFDSDHNLDVRLLSGSTYNGKHTDLYLFVLYKKLEQHKEFESLSFIHKDVNNYRTETNFPSIEVLNDERIIITINYGYNLLENNKGFEIKLEDDSLLSEFSNTFSKYQSVNEKHIFQVVNDISEMDTMLDSIIKNLLTTDSVLKNSI